MLTLDLCCDNGLNMVSSNNQAPKVAGKIDYSAECGAGAC